MFRRALGSMRQKPLQVVLLVALIAAGLTSPPASAFRFPRPFWSKAQTANNSPQVSAATSKQQAELPAGAIAVAQAATPDDLDVVVPVLTSGVAVSGSTSVPGQVLRFTFQATAGERVFVRGVGGSGASSLDATFVDPLGRGVGIMYLSGLSPSTMGPLVASVTGQYQVRVSLSGSSGALVGASLQVWSVGSDVVVPVLTSGVAVSGSTSVPGQVLRFTFQATAGQKFDIRAVSTSSASAELIDSSARSIGTVICCGATATPTSLLRRVTGCTR
jgi:hypothetical protein